jgi:hypothetical protein
MKTHILAAAAGNPASNWVNQWKAGWDSTPSAHTTATYAGSNLIVLALVVAVIAVVVIAFRKIASA